MKIEKVLMCFICLLLLAACGSNGSKSSSSASSARSGNIPTPNPAAPPGNFLYSGTTEAIFLAWVNTSGSLSGQTQDARLQSNNYGSEQVNSTHGSFTGVLTNGQVSLNFGGFLGWSYNVTGTYNGTTLMLNLPTKDGSIGSFPFVPATSTDFNNAVSALQTTAGNDNATVTAAQYQATANANATITTYSQQRSVANANYNLGNALSQLNSDANVLASFSETDTLNSYANTWKTMQNDYTTEQNDAKAGCGDNASNYYHVQSDAYQVNSDEYQMNSDDYQLSSDKNQYDSDMSAVQNDIQAVQNDWAKLQQAVANNPTNIPTAAYTSGDVNKSIQNAQNAEKTAQGVWQSAQSSASQYDQKASNLNSQAQALPEKMGC